MIVKLFFEDLKEVVGVTFDNALQAFAMGAAIGDFAKDKKELLVGRGDSDHSVIIECPDEKTTWDLVNTLHKVAIEREFPAKVVRESILLPEVHA